MKSTIELLQEAREWLSVEQHWCRGHRWGPGETYCAIGALERASGGRRLYRSWFNDPELLPAMTLLARIIAVRCGRQFAHPAHAVIDFNDGLGWSPTLELFDLAIKLEQEDINRQAKELVDSCTNMDALTPIIARS